MSELGFGLLLRSEVDGWGQNYLDLTVQRLSDALRVKKF